MTGVEVVMAGAAIAGAGLQVYGQIEGGAARKKAADADAANKRMQADELILRQGINEQVLRDNSVLQERAYSSSFSGTGKEGGGIGGVLTMKARLEENIRLSRHDADFKAKMLRAGADIDSRLASDMMTAGILTGVGTGLSVAGDISEKYMDYGKASPKVTKLSEK